MKLYRHYKQKPYKYLGTVKHSETLEDLVLYETLYENDLGKLWVRPKQMFFEEIEQGGRKRPRFEKIPITIETMTGVTPTVIERIAPIVKTIGGEWDPGWFNGTLNNRVKHHCALAVVEGQTIGYKLGYENDPWEFYSWLGGVLPEYRELGIASALMTAQHEWCASQGYHKILTKTQNRWREMLLLNIKAGFHIIGTQESAEGGLKIILEKKLKG